MSVRFLDYKGSREASPVSSPDSRNAPDPARPMGWGRYWLYRLGLVLRDARGATTGEYALVYSDNVRHVRRLDDLGRVVLPIESRQRLGLKRGNAVEVVDVPQGILLRPIRAGRARP